MCKEERKGICFFLKPFFFIVEWLGRGGRGFFSFDMLKGDGRGRGLIFLYKFNMDGGGEGFKVGLINLILAKIN
jgi:hypothetical protein